jgi:hypothetical protein
MGCQSGCHIGIQIGTNGMTKRDATWDVNMGCHRDEVIPNFRRKAIPILGCDIGITSGSNRDDKTGCSAGCHIGILNGNKWDDKTGCNMGCQYGMPSR